MNQRHPCHQTYALRLCADTAQPTAVLGQIEHVLSGECLVFDSAAGLVAALAALQARVLQAPPLTPGHNPAAAG
jgi:hypothetical protein